MKGDGGQKQAGGAGREGGHTILSCLQTRVCDSWGAMLWMFPGCRGPYTEPTSGGEGESSTGSRPEAASETPSAPGLQPALLPALLNRLGPLPTLRPAAPGPAGFLPEPLAFPCAFGRVLRLPPPRSPASRTAPCDPSPGTILPEGWLAPGGVDRHVRGGRKGLERASSRPTLGREPRP